MNPSAVIPFFATAFLAIILTIFLFNLKKEKRETRLPTGERVIKEVVVNKFLHIMILAFLIASIFINGLVTMQAGSKDCAWRVINATETGSTYSFESDYICKVNEDNDGGINYMRLINWGSYMLGFWLLLYFIITIVTTAQELRREYERGRGR